MGKDSSISKLSVVPQAKSVNETVGQSNLKPLQEKSPSTSESATTNFIIPFHPDVTSQLINWTNLDTTPVSSLTITTTITGKMHDNGNVAASSLANDPPPTPPVDAKCHETKEDRIIRSICRFNYLQKQTKRKVFLHFGGASDMDCGKRKEKHAICKYGETRVIKYAM